MKFNILYYNFILIKNYKKLNIFVQLQNRTEFNFQDRECISINNYKN